MYESCAQPWKSQAPGCLHCSCTRLVTKGCVQGDGFMGRPGFPERLILRAGRINNCLPCSR